jgi:hypothetical protein
MLFLLVRILWILRNHLCDTLMDVNLKLRPQFISGRTTGIILAVIASAVLLFFHFGIAGNQGDPHFFGNRNTSLFDFWSVQHFFSGIIIGSFVLWFARKKYLKGKAEFLLFILLCALVWEIAELAMEAGRISLVVAEWKAGYEHWSNRFIGDLGTVVLGGVIAWRLPWAWKIVIIPALLWLALNVFAPDSMFIQSLILH